MVLVGVGAVDEALSFRDEMARCILAEACQFTSLRRLLNLLSDGGRQGEPERLVEEMVGCAVFYRCAFIAGILKHILINRICFLMMSIIPTAMLSWFLQVVLREKRRNGRLRSSKALAPTLLRSPIWVCENGRKRNQGIQVRDPINVFAVRLSCLDRVYRLSSRLRNAGGGPDG